MNGPSQSAPGARHVYEQRQLDAIAARWDARASRWEETLKDPACHLNEDGAYDRFLREVKIIIRQRRHFCARAGVIDAGCGTGVLLAQVISSFAWGIGVDISKEMIRLAAEKQLAKAQFLVGDCFRLPALCPRSGAVLSRGVLLSHYGRQHAPALLAAGKASLVPGGFLVFDFLNEAARTKNAHAPGSKTYYGRDEIRAMALEAGFKAAAVLGGGPRRVLLLLAERD